MKYLILLFAIICNACLVAPCIAAEETENVAGETITIIDEHVNDNTGNASFTSGWQDKTQEIIMNAMSLTGIKYKYGGTSPETGFDCSGFVRYVFSQATNLALPPTARAISQLGKTVNKDELQPGDLVFFNTLKTAFSHVGIYVGDNKFVHAPRSGAAVRVESMQTGYWAKRFNGAQRLDKLTENASN
jgi:cell wall-associated NlpC family hydrolase